MAEDLLFVLLDTSDHCVDFIRHDLSLRHQTALQKKETKGPE